MIPKKKIILASAIIGVIVSIILIFWGRGTFDHAMLVFMPGIWIGLPCILLLIISLIIGRKWKPKIMSWISTILISIIIFLAIQIPSLYAGRILQKAHIGQAQAFLWKLIPDIENFKNKNNRYPNSFTELKIGQAGLPLVLRLDKITFAEFEGNWQIIISDPKEFGIYGFIYWADKKYWEFFVN